VKWGMYCVQVTLSKVRALKTQMVEIVKTLDLDLSTAALAHVYLEKLILKNLVRKHSRKLTAVSLEPPLPRPSPSCVW